jgi:hypothetical protein
MNYSEKFKEALAEVDDAVSTHLLTLEGTEQDVDDVDISNTDGFVSFIREGKDTKNKIKAGRFVSKFTDQFTAREIELFVNKFKSLGKFHKIKDKFYLGQGEDFEFAYSVDNYVERTGSLGGSCMNNVGDGRLKLYSANDKKIKILILKDDAGKVLGRAVIWKNAFIREGESAEDRNNGDSMKVTIMDRPYTTKDFYTNIFDKYATEQGWYIRRGGLSFQRPDGEMVKCRVKVNLKDFQYGNYPYLDTMRSVSKKGTISNKRWKDEIRFY